MAVAKELLSDGRHNQAHDSEDPSPEVSIIFCVGIF